jgi:hypothetical protein
MGGMRSRFCQLRPSLSSIYQVLLRWHLVPWIQRIYPDKKKHLSADSVPVCTAKTTQRLLVEFRFWLPYSPDLKLLYFSISCVFQSKVQARTHSNLATLFLSITEEWDLLAVVYICKTCRALRCRHEAIAKENEV